MKEWPKQRHVDHVALIYFQKMFDSTHLRDALQTQIVCFFNIVQTPSEMLYT